jgi:hypothetical protein
MPLGGVGQEPPLRAGGGCSEGCSGTNPDACAFDLSYGDASGASGRAANSNPGGPTGPLGTASRTPWAPSR